MLFYDTNGKAYGTLTFFFCPSRFRADRVWLVDEPRDSLVASQRASRLAAGAHQSAVTTQDFVRRSKLFLSLFSLFVFLLSSRTYFFCVAIFVFRSLYGNRLSGKINLAANASYDVCMLNCPYGACKSGDDNCFGTLLSYCFFFF